MQRFRKILIVPITNGPEAPPGLFEAVELAERSGAQLSMLAHLDSQPEALLGERHGELLSTLKRLSREAAIARLAGWAALAGRPEIDTEVVGGSLHRGVHDAVEAAGHDLVIIATDGTGVANTSARRIVDACHCPVWLLRPGFRGASVLAAVDPSHDREHNARILELARSQAEVHGGSLRVMHAWRFFGADLLAGTSIAGVSTEQLAALADEVEAAHRDWLDDLAGGADLPAGTTVHLIDGPPVTAIEGLAVLYGVDLVVLGAGRSRSDRAAIGSTTDGALSDLRYSTLAVSPPA